ncbi:ribosomal protein S18-alanine N-acetyltransferase [Leifsonia virtsii]|uniref:[Ribosomal protein bS18]-alanine N-acetyltransferase n=1 Tax=Leifsonia virtsii TaxID=3035915 RepID=A0ABT8IYB6_9MICO|nr:ribosomal protein S18-alanine N-acetyltransferase [Leifsonia virtsii]MDN4597406.1 ribosomal protein S18-alanine N-acetyltransferase [Leifsonia virtsii]
MELERSIFVNDAWSERSMLSEVTGEHGYYLVAFDLETPDRIDGYAGLLAPRGGAEGDIQTIAVAPHARRRGLGRTLMLALIAETRRRGARELFLEVRADNPGAQALYRELGFEEIGVRPRYYQPDGVDAIVMRLAVPNPETTLA